MNGLFHGKNLQRVSFEVFDGLETTNEHSLYRSPNLPSARPAFIRIAHLKAANRTWTVRYQTTPIFDATSAGGGVGWVSIGGVIISPLLGGITLALARAEARSRMMRVA